jgi:hypothetical protein
MDLRAVIRIWMLFLVIAVGCAHVPTGGGIRLPEAVDFAAYDGKLAFRIVPADDSIRVEDGAGDVMVVLRLRGESLAIEDVRGRLVGVVVPPADERRGFRVLSPDARYVLFELRVEPDGDLRVVDARDALVYEAKRRVYGFKVLDRNGEVESRIRLGANKISVRDASGVTFLSTRDPLPPESVVALSLEDLRFEYAAGLSMALVHWTLPAS